MERKLNNLWNKVDEIEKNKIFDFSKGYKHFLDKAKTERVFIKEAIKLAKENGFVDANSLEKLNAGDKIYYNYRDKNLALMIIGRDDIEKGANFVVSHVDAPRLDLKTNPIFEDTEFALGRTHYYGGIKKYQWASLPLELNGIVILENGDEKHISIGSDENDPIFIIPDLLPHLMNKVQGDRKSRDIIKGEELIIVMGSIPSTIDDKEIKNKVKYHILEKLNEKYGMKEEDFISAELQLTPAGKAKDVGLDRGLISAYGQDDRICAYSSLMSILDITETPEKTAVVFFVDKEEIGSTGATGLQSNYIEYFMAETLNKLKNSYNELLLKRVFWNSNALSADVTAGINPIFKSVHEDQNAAKLGYGIVIMKYTGSGGKYSSSEADAEFVYKIRKLFNENNIGWQTGMLGKVDEGGGGTVAKFLAHYGIDTLDAGPALIGMHSPFEVSSKIDIYNCFKAYKIFLLKL